MSNRNWIKGMRRRASAKGHGKGLGAIGDMVRAHDERELDIARGIERIRAEYREKKAKKDERDALAKLVAQDQKRSKQQSRRG